MHMLIMANHDTQKWRGEVIERGTFVTSYGSLSNETGLTVREVRTALKHLISTGDIEVKATKQNTRIYIVKYDFYQKSDKQNDKVETKEISDDLGDIEHSENLDVIESDNQATNLRQTSDTQSDKQTTTNKNVKKLKNEKNDKNKKKKTYKGVVEEYTENADLREALMSYVEMRQKEKGFTLRALDLNLKTLSELACDEQIKIEIVNQSVAKTWKGFYELKEKGQSPKTKQEELPF